MATRSRRIRGSVCNLWLMVAAWFCGVTPAGARDLHVDPPAPFQASAERLAFPTIREAIRQVRPGDTVRLEPKMYRETIELRDLAGTAEQPIVFDGHGAVLNGCDPLDLDKWVEVSAGLYRADDLMPLTQAIVDRWFFLIDGNLQRMGRCLKGPSEPLKAVADLQPGEWTFVLNAERTKTARAGYIHGSFFLRTMGDRPLSESGIEFPRRMAGVSMHGQCAHLVVRNVTATRVYNDGFNLSDCVECRFENIAAIDCADDGISAHGSCRYSVNGFVSMRNGTGICDTGASVTEYRRMLIRDCIGFDLFFLDTGTYTVRDSLIDSSAAKSVYVLSSDPAKTPCRLSLENVAIRRTRGPQEFRVNANCEVILDRVTLDGLDVQAVGGVVALRHSRIGGRVPEDAGATNKPRRPHVHRWPNTRWTGSNNVYAVDSIRVGDQSFSFVGAKSFFETVAGETNSRWVDPEAPAGNEEGVGASLEEQTLPKPPRLLFTKSPNDGAVNP